MRFAQVARHTGWHHIVEVVVFRGLSVSSPAMADAAPRPLEVIGVLLLTQQHPTVDIVPAVLQAHLLALSFLHAHKVACRCSG